MSAVTKLTLDRNMRVLEIGCGTGSMAEIVVSQADGVRYTGLDKSTTMIETARERRSRLIARGSVKFEQGVSETMPFQNESFDRVFSIGLIHFWVDPLKSFTEVRRVMRPGALMFMGCLGPEGAPPFARAAYGFHLHEPFNWRSFCEAAGFCSIDVQSLFMPPEGGPEIIHVIAQK